MTWLWLLATPASAADLTPAQQALLMLKVVGYDRNRQARGADLVRIGVLGDLHGKSRARARDVHAALEELVASGLTLDGRPVEVVDLLLADDEDLLDALKTAHPNALYVAPAIHHSAGSIAQATREVDVLTFSSDPQAVDDGLAVGLLAESGRAQIIIHLEAARDEGADLPAGLLQLARVVH